MEINRDDLYNVFNGDHGNYLLIIEVEKGFQFNSFTFG